MNENELTHLGSGFFVDGKGNLTGSYTININGRSITYNINSTVEKLEEKEKISNNPDSVKREPKEDEMILPTKFKLDLLIHFPRVCFNEMQDSILEGHNHFIIKISHFHEGMIKFKKYRQHVDLLVKTSNLNIRGKEFEREGFIDEAISVYEENIILGYPASHSFDRLMILYSKKKDYINEKRTIERALEIYPNDDKYKKRLEKLVLKLNR